MNTPVHNGPPSAPRIVAGSARSGTTWVVDVLARANAAGTLFEPLNPDTVSGADAIQNRLITPHEDAPQATAFFRQLFSGGQRNVWTLGRVYPQKLLPGGECTVREALATWRSLLTNYWRHGRSPSGLWVYKLIRANLMLAWLVAQFGARVVFVVRHPGAVVASRIRRGWPWQPALRTYLADARIRDQLTPSAHALFAQIDDDVTGHGAVWAVQHLVALEQWRGNNFAVFFYEDLRAARSDEWSRLVNALALAHVPDASLRETPSQQADPAADRSRVLAAPQRWRSSMTANDLTRLDALLAATGLAELYRSGDDAPGVGAERYRG